MSAHTLSIDALATKLVQEAPERNAETVAELREALHANGSPLAFAIARIVELVGEDLVDPGIALPALAEACATLVSSDADARALDAAQLRVESLEPMPGTSRPIVSIDVPLTSLRRR